jgi:uncharacterized membrane protein
MSNLVKHRISQIDQLRGWVMLLMILDHAREYSAGPGGLSDPMNLATVTPLLFLFRWLTHFCAPVFTLLMGLSLGLHSSSVSMTEMSRKCLRRGALLLLLEFTIVSWSWTFNPTWPRMFFQIIGALGVAQIALAAAVFLPKKMQLMLALVLLALHNLFDSVQFAPDGLAHYVWSLLHQKNLLPLWGGFEVRTTYPVIPIIGLTIFGYWLAKDVEDTKKLFLWGVGTCCLFLLLRLLIGYGDSSPFVLQSNPLYSVFSALNVTKYPLSLQFVCMTIGPALIVLSVGTRRRIATAWMELLGRVPLFFYVGHLYLLHLLALLGALAMGFSLSEFDFVGRFGGIPAGFGFPLWFTPSFAGVCAALLYPLCRWYDQLRRSGRFPWLSYL